MYVYVCVCVCVCVCCVGSNLDLKESLKFYAVVRNVNKEMHENIEES